MRFLYAGQGLDGLQNRLSRARRRKNHLHVALQISFSAGELFGRRSRQPGHLIDDAARFRQPRQGELPPFRIDKNPLRFIEPPA